MRQSVFITIVLIAAIVISAIIFYTLLPDFIRQGGPLVVLLMTLSIMEITFILERLFSLNKAKGNGSLLDFIAELNKKLQQRDVEGALTLCHNQQGSVANVLRAALERFRQISRENLTSDRQVSELQRVLEDATSLETPLLERNLIALSTIASISTMVGLLGTVIGMIRSFRAMAHAGAPDAIQLAIGISEALINTAGGLFAAITAIVAYSFFTNKVDNFTYEIEEAGHRLVRHLTGT